MTTTFNLARPWAPFALAVASTTVLLGGCGGSDNDNNSGSTSPTVAAISCAELAGKTVPASQIGLPTGGATVTAATAVKSSDSGNTNGDYCKVTGTIAPDATVAATGTPVINFQLNLPETWNGKSVHMGGGGYNGTVVTGTTAVSFAPGSVPLAQGYATFGSDSGHVGNSATADFALNEGALLNFGYQHLKKTRDTALALIKLRYAKSVDKSYFAGASTGGREGMTVVERFPTDYDGVIANAPAIYFWGMRLIGIRMGQASYATPGGFIPTAKLDLLRKTAIDACDSDDGAADRIISNVEACRTKQAAIIAQLRCPNGADAGATCLSDAQLNTARAISDDVVLPYQLAFGVNRYPGYNLFQGADFGHGLGMGTSATAVSPPTVAANGYLYTQGDNYLKYLITKNPAFNSLAFNINSPGQYQQSLVQSSDVVGAMNPDTSAFRARGGKLIVLQGLADDAVSPNGTITYYQDQVGRYGQSAVSSFFRLYTVPGFGHGIGEFVPSWDAMGALDRWVSQGTAPETLVGTDTNTATSGRSRPLCVYPTFPRYSGSGDLNAAASYRCATQ
jgi:feruloyl esterase